MTLSATQLAALTVMEIPIWQQRTDDNGQANPVAPVDLQHDKAIMIDHHERLSETENRLLQAIFFALQIDASEVARLTARQLEALAAQPDCKLNVLVMGPCPAAFADATPVISGGKLMTNGMRIFAADSLETLLETPARKAQFWQKCLAWLRTATE